MDDVAFGMRVIIDNIPTRRWQVLKEMGDDLLTTSTIAQKSDMSTGSAKRVLEELISLKLVERVAREDKADGTDRRTDSYKISDEWVKTVKELKGEIPGDSIADSGKDITIKKRNIVNRNSPPQLSNVDHTDEPTVEGFQAEERKIIPFKGDPRFPDAILQGIKTETLRPPADIVTVIKFEMVKPPD